MRKNVNLLYGWTPEQCRSWVEGKPEQRMRVSAFDISQMLGEGAPSELVSAVESFSVEESLVQGMDVIVEGDAPDTHRWEVFAIMIENEYPHIKINVKRKKKLN